MNRKCLLGTDHVSASFVSIRSVHSIWLQDAFRYFGGAVGVQEKPGKNLGQLAGVIQHSAQNAG